MGDETFSVESSAGRLQVQFGWDGWVAVTIPRSNGTSHAARRIVASRGDLEELLLGFGLPEGEVGKVSKALWRQRPFDAPEERPATGPAYDSGLFVLVALLVLIGGAVLLASMVGAF